MRRNITRYLTTIIIFLFHSNIFPQFSIEEIPTNFVGKIITIAFPTDSSIIVGTETGGIYYTDIRRINWIIFEPLEQLSYIKSASTGELFALANMSLFKRNVESENWVKINLPDEITDIISMEIDENNTIYISYINGIYKSIDLGMSWQQTNLRYYYFNKLYSYRKDEVFAVTQSTALLSVNQGRTWKIIGKDFFDNLYGYILKIEQSTNGVIFTSSTNQIYGNIFKTIDNGEHWEKIFTDSVMTNIISIDDKNLVGLIKDKSYTDLIHLEEFNGTWSKKTICDTISRGLSFISKSRTGVIYCGGAGGKLYRVIPNPVFINENQKKESSSSKNINTIFSNYTPALNDNKNYNGKDINTFNQNILDFSRFDRSNNIDINNIIMSIKNNGALNLGEGGAYWLRIGGAYKTIVFDHGPIIIGKIDGEPRISFSQWISLFAPGPIINGKAALQCGPLNPDEYRVYKINKGDDEISNKDYLEWPTELGAASVNNKPVIFNDQTLYTVFNAFDDSSDGRRKVDHYRMEYPPMPVEIHQYTYGYKTNSSDIFSDIIFFEWEIINKGNKSIDSAYFGLWTDIDFMNALNNIPAVDTLLNLAYCWNRTDFYINEFEPSPAVGYMMLYGPAVESPGDTAIFKGEPLLNYRNLGITSFHGIITEWPWNYASLFYDTELAWKYARGLDPFGNPWINYYTGNVTKFMFSGNPVNNKGWIHPDNYTDGEAGFYLFSGPFDLAPNDTQWTMIALIPGLGADKYDSISKMKRVANILKLLNYDQIVTKTYFKEEEISLPEYFSLSQNFPNPFNASTKVRYEIPIQTNVNLSVYDILGRKVAEIVNKEQSAGYYEEEFNSDGLASGVYFCRLEAFTFSKTIKLILLK